MSDRGYVWFALNNSTTDYVELSKKLASSIKKHNKHNQVCVCLLYTSPSPRD